MLLRGVPLPRRLLISRRQESSVARALGGKLVAGSGNTAVAQGDVKTPRFLIECKTTEGKKGWRLTLGGTEGWYAIEGKAIRTRKEPAMVIQMEGRSLAVVDVEFFYAARLCFEQNGGKFPDPPPPNT